MNTNQTPPIGGANLELTLTFSDLMVSEVVNIENSVCDAFGFSLASGYISRLGEELNFEKVPIKLNVPDWEFLQKTSNDIEDITFNYHAAKIGDIETRLSMLYDFGSNLIQISVTEDFIWAFSGDATNAKFERLEKFALLAEPICEIKNPIHASIGTEGCHREPVDQNERLPNFCFRSFCEQNLTWLFDWYINVYAKRWDK